MISWPTSLQSCTPTLSPTLARSLAEEGVCDACVQRFCGVRSGVRGGVWEAEAPSFVRGVHVATAATTACVVCLGILASSSSSGSSSSSASAATPASVVDAASAALVGVIDARGYDVDAYCAEFTTPNSCFVRQHCVLMRLHARATAAAAAAAAAASADADADATAAAAPTALPPTRRQLESSIIPLKDAMRARLLAAIAPRLLPARHDPNATLRLQVRIVHADSDSECDAVVHATGGVRSGGGGGGGGKKRRRTEKKHAAQTQQHSTRDLLRRIGELSATACDALSTAPSATPCTVVASATRASVSIAGRYRKLRRGLSQTPFFVDNVRRGTTSVEELLTQTLTAQRADRFDVRGGQKFMSSGREDIDVRMLGEGRPFAVELIDATRIRFNEAELITMQDDANTAAAGDVELVDLHFATAKELQAMKDNIALKRKTYGAIIWISRPITPADLTLLEAQTELIVQQKTPMRVLHRRSLLTRPKTIHSMKCTQLAPNWMLLALTTSSGTYIKEFVHGDLGRTQPNIGSLLDCDADIVQLDVLGFHEPAK